MDETDYNDKSQEAEYKHPQIKRHASLSPSFHRGIIYDHDTMISLVFPHEIILVIFGFCKDRKTRHSILMTNRKFQKLLTPKFYDIEIIKNRKCMLSEKEFERYWDTFFYIPIICYHDRINRWNSFDKSIFKPVLQHLFLYFKDSDRDYTRIRTVLKHFFDGIPSSKNHPVQVPDSDTWINKEVRLKRDKKRIEECLSIFHYAWINHNLRKQKQYQKSIECMGFPGKEYDFIYNQDGHAIMKERYSEWTDEEIIPQEDSALCFCECLISLLGLTSYLTQVLSLVTVNTDEEQKHLLTLREIVETYVHDSSSSDEYKDDSDNDEKEEIFP